MAKLKIPTFIYSSNANKVHNEWTYSEDTFFENQMLSKYSKMRRIGSVGGTCAKESILNPFDLSNPAPKHKNINDFICSTRWHQTGFSKNKCEINEDKYSLDSGCESNTSSESILSFASRSSDKDTDYGSSNDSGVWSSGDSQDVFSKLQEISKPAASCEGTGYLLPIVADSSSKDSILIPQISPLTLANIISGNHSLNNKLTVFDCRFPYEYSGGHIANSINVYTRRKLLQTLFDIKESQFNEIIQENLDDFGKKLEIDERIYVFYCEFSSHRGPKMAQCLRELDRTAHMGGRDLFMPNIYVLFGGYKDFHNQFPQLCFPDKYVRMNLGQYRKEEKQYFREVQESEKQFNSIKNKSPKDILFLFSCPRIISGS